eukprot:3662811-Rhodomonas_salina.1
MLAAPKPSVDSGDGWQTVGKTTKLTWAQLQKIIEATGQTAAQLRGLALQVTEALLAGLITIPTRTRQETEITAGLRTELIEEWADLLAKDINDIWHRLPDLLSRGNIVPLLLQMLVESNMVQYADDAEASPTALIMLLPDVTAGADRQHEDPSEGDDDSDVPEDVVDTSDGSIVVVNVDGMMEDKASTAGLRQGRAAHA